LGAVNTAESIAVADLNEDGKMDLVLAGGGVGVWLGKGDGTFQLSNVYSNTGGTSQLLLADLDQDGKQDLIGINATSNSADVRLGNGDGTFGPIKTFSLGGKQISWGTIADLNGDGRPDLVSASWCGPYCPNEEGAVGILLNVASSPSTTTTTLTSSLNPSIYGQKVTFTAKVTSTSGPVPTGKINFILSGKNAGSPTLNTNGVATLIRSTLNSGTSSLMAMYQGDGNNLKSQTAILNQVVEPSTTKATLASSPNPSTSGQAVTFTAKITSATVVPTGSVTFQVGKTVLGTAQLSAGKAVFTTTTLPVGSTVVTVTYNSNSNFKPSLASVRQTVQ
jgi:hypothetical protein